jgi:hypothetical protein
MDEDTNEYIRPPDEPIRECLLPPSGTIPERGCNEVITKCRSVGIGRLSSRNNEQIDSVLFEQQELQRILEESEIDYELQFALEESKRMEDERNERCRHFADFRFKIKQFEKMDKSNAEFYAEMIHYIDMYERYGSSPFVVTEQFYMAFRKTVDNMRLNREEKARLQTLMSIHTE